MPLMPSFMLFHALRMAELRLALSLAAGDQKLHSNTEILRLGLGQPQVCSREKCEAFGWKVLLGDLRTRTSDFPVMRVFSFAAMV